MLLFCSYLYALLRGEVQFREASVLSLRRLNNRTTRVFPAKHVPAKAGSRNPEATYGGFRVKHGMTYCMVIYGDTTLAEMGRSIEE
jgi:hypothetical protein